jgi:hypothetical protein
MPLGVRFFGNEFDSHTARVRRRQQQQQVAKQTSWPPVCDGTSKKHSKVLDHRLFLL